MLRRADGSAFASSRARYLDALPGRLTQRDAKIYVRIAVGDPKLKTTAMLDTGATYSVLDADLAEELRAFQERPRLRHDCKRCRTILSVLIDPLAAAASVIPSAA